MNDQPNDPQSNGYQPQPTPPVVDNTASYGKRLGAFTIDVFFLFIAFMFLVRFLDLVPAPNPDVQIIEAEMLKKLNELSDSQRTLIAFWPMISFLVLHGFLLYQYGQTLGKRFMGIAIVTLDNRKPAFFPLIVQRYFSQWLMGMVPMIGIPLRLADILMIFRGDKRCLHDLIAGTKVIDLRIKVAAEPNSFIA